MNRFAAIPSAVFAGLLLVACAPEAPQPTVESAEPADPVVADAAMSEGVDGCSAKVESFGPSQIIRGESFNTQVDGNSAYWVAMAPGSEGFTLAFDGQPVEYIMGGDTISFLHQEPLIAAVQQRDMLELDVMCGDRVVDEIDISVVAVAPPAG
ncbi:MAG: hypothetical protein M3Q40_00615 [Pseudomonadota bacterium]|nr:hypothetical protein [Pseudomonadota bacterium]